MTPRDASGSALEKAPAAPEKAPEKARGQPSQATTKGGVKTADFPWIYIYIHDIRYIHIYDIYIYIYI